MDKDFETLVDLGFIKNEEGEFIYCFDDLCLSVLVDERNIYLFRDPHSKFILCKIDELGNKNFLDFISSIRFKILELIHVSEVFEKGSKGFSNKVPINKGIFCKDLNI